MNSRRIRLLCLCEDFDSQLYTGRDLFYSGFMFLQSRTEPLKCPGSAQEIHINRDENTHLWLFGSIIRTADRRAVAFPGRQIVTVR